MTWDDTAKQIGTVGTPIVTFFLGLLTHKFRATEKTIELKRVDYDQISKAFGAAINAASMLAKLTSWDSPEDRQEKARHEFWEAHKILEGYEARGAFQISKHAHEDLKEALRAVHWAFEEQFPEEIVWDDIESSLRRRIQAFNISMREDLYLRSKLLIPFRRARKWVGTMQQWVIHRRPRRRSEKKSN